MDTIFSCLRTLFCHCQPNPVPPEVALIPDTGQHVNARHQTGATYTFTPSTRIVSKAAGQWNTYEIEANRDQIRVTLNGELVTNFTVDGSYPVTGTSGCKIIQAKSSSRTLLLKSLPD